MASGALLAVEDDGPGVPPQLREQIFQPFHQGRKSSGRGSGSGIGLALVARFANLHGGQAWVEDRAGGGASFRVYLPGGAPADEPPAAERVPAGP
jgi:signal transduction histidine kinase